MQIPKKDLIIKKSKIGQFPNSKGIFANRDFKKGEIVIKYNLKELTKKDFEKLPKKKKYLHTNTGGKSTYTPYQKDT